jgi:RimJ/RimL family protein N-acetyltransferase
MLSPSYPISTTRLMLRPLEAADAAALHGYRSLPHVCRYLPFEPMTAMEISKRLAGPWARRSMDDEGQSITLGVVLRETSMLVGDVILFWHSREHRGGEIGYVFSPAAAGHGYATEAAHALLHVAFDDLGLHRVIARLDARNHASAQVLQRLGMRQESHFVQNELFKGVWRDELGFALLESEWKDLPKGGTRMCHDHTRVYSRGRT